MSGSQHPQSQRPDLGAQHNRNQYVLNTLGHFSKFEHNHIEPGLWIIFLIHRFMSYKPVLHTKNSFLPLKPHKDLLESLTPAITGYIVSHI
jgi:hypothetical protein